MANINKIPDAYSYFRSSSGWSGWKTVNVYSSGVQVYRSSLGSYSSAVYLVNLNADGAIVSSASLNVTFDLDSDVGERTYICEIYAGNFPAEPDKIGEQQWTTTSSGTRTAHTFSFSGLNAETSDVCFLIDTFSTVGSANVLYPSATVNYSLPTLSVNLEPSTVAVGETLSLSFGNRIGQTLTVTFRSGSTQLHQITANADSINVTPTFSWFTIAGSSSNSMSVSVAVSDGLGRTASASCSVTRTALGVSISPASVYVDNPVSLTFSGRYDQTLSVVFKYQTTELYSTTAGGDNLSVTPRASWFETAGVSGSSMSVSVSVTDGQGRTASASFSLTNPQASTATPTAPKSTTVDGADVINFAWSVSTNWGTQTGADLQWSTDNAVWTDLAHISGSGKTWTAPAVKFPAGTIYWRVRVTNSYGITSEWSSSVSFTVQYAAQSQVIPVNSPTSGIINAALARTFQVALEASGPVYTPFTISAATFYWRSGTSGDWTTAAMTASGSSASVTIAANTFPSGTIQWKAEATDNTSRTTETAVYTLTALVAEVGAAPLRPINTVESNNGPITFAWTYGSVDGSAQAAAELQYLVSNTWTALASITGDATSWTAPASTFSAGTVTWRVRAKNSADVWGPWSDGASFKAYGAPVVAGVSGDGKPFLTITWQTNGQLAYEIMVDGTQYGPYMGADVRSYTLKHILANGLHTVKVRAQSRFSLWSEWAEASVEVTNVPTAYMSVSVYNLALEPSVNVSIIGGAQIPTIIKQPADYQAQAPEKAFFRVYYAGPLGNYDPIAWEFRVNSQAEWQPYTGTVTAVGAINPQASQDLDGYQYRAKLSNAAGEIYSEPATFFYGSPKGEVAPPKSGKWTSETGYYLIYRNGKLIAKTYEKRFIDRFAIGTNQYIVLQRLKDGSYNGAVSSDITVSIDCPMIAPLSGGDWLELKLSENRNREQAVTIAQEVAYVQYAGQEYPTEEIGVHRTKTIKLDVSELMENEDFAAAFQALIGKRVVVKTPHGELVVGVLQAVERRDPEWFRHWTFSVRQGKWRDFVDESGA